MRLHACDFIKDNTSEDHNFFVKWWFANRHMAEDRQPDEQDRRLIEKQKSSISLCTYFTLLSQQQIHVNFPGR